MSGAWGGRSTAETLRPALTDRQHYHLLLNRRDPMRLFADRAYMHEAIYAPFDGA
jgi:hypothetical protein